MADPRRPDPSQGVFETMLVLDGRPVELEAHLARLQASLAELFPGHDPPPLDVPVERGPYGHLRTGTSAAGLDEERVLTAMRVTVVPDGAEALGTRISTLRVPHGPQPVSLQSFTVPGGLGQHKWADRSLLKKAESGFSDDALPLLVDEDGAVLEASRANVFAVRGGALFTPPLDGRILPGITRMRVLEIAAARGLGVEETELSADDLLAADEVFLTGSVRGVERARSLDEAVLAGGGSVTSDLAVELWRAWTSAPVG